MVINAKDVAYVMCVVRGNKLRQSVRSIFNDTINLRLKMLAIKAPPYDMVHNSASKQERFVKEQKSLTADFSLLKMVLLAKESNVN